MSTIVPASEAEWEVLRVVWSLDTATSRDVATILKETQNWELATTKTLLGRLVKKGYLDTHKDGNKFIYTATISENDSIRYRVTSTFDTICAGSIPSALATAINTYDLTDKDRQDLITLLQKKETVDHLVCNCVPSGDSCQCEPGKCKCSHKEA